VGAAFSLPELEGCELSTTFVRVMIGDGKLDELVPCHWADSSLVRSRFQRCTAADNVQALSYISADSNALELYCLNGHTCRGVGQGLADGQDSRWCRYTDPGINITLRKLSIRWHADEDTIASTARDGASVKTAMEPVHDKITLSIPLPWKASTNVEEIQSKATSESVQRRWRIFIPRRWKSKSDLSSSQAHV
jgi:hypothetical protein